jgi:ferrous iron transport protein B
VATLAVVKRETGGWLWPSVMFGYMLALAYAAAFLVYQGATALGLG